ncbi:MAG: hypothetical protein KKH92_05175 [Firmicutes bacterium]|nr:hypothetical protein [Bacillota bacterium]
MKKYYYWMMNAKLNIAFFVIFGGFYTFIGLVLADNRFELDLGLYYGMIILWLVALFNLISLIMIKKCRNKDEPIPLLFLILISITMVSVIVVFLFSIDKQQADIPYQSEYNEKNKKNSE